MEKRMRCLGMAGLVVLMSTIVAVFGLSLPADAAKTLKIGVLVPLRSIDHPIKCRQGAQSRLPASAKPVRLPQQIPPLFGDTSFDLKCSTIENASNWRSIV